MAMASWLYWLWVMGVMAKAITLGHIRTKARKRGLFELIRAWALILVVSYYNLIDGATLFCVRVDISFGLNDRDVVILIELFDKLGG